MVSVTHLDAERRLRKQFFGLSDPDVFRRRLAELTRLDSDRVAFARRHSVDGALTSKTATPPLSVVASVANPKDGGSRA